MRDVSVVLELEKVIPVSIQRGEDPELKASEIINEMIEKNQQNASYLSTFRIDEIDFEWIVGDLMFALVKKAIDAYDPYFVHPDSYDEYDGESSRIAEKIIKGMSVDEIAEIMKEEFNWSFTPTFTKEDFSHTAKTVFHLLEDSFNKTDNLKKEEGKKVHVYVKLYLRKVIPVKVLEKEGARAKAIEMVLDKIDSDKKTECSLSSFNRSIGWGTVDVSK